MNGKKNSTRNVLVFFMFLLFFIFLCVRDAAVFHRVAASVFHRGVALFRIYSISGTVNGAVPSGVNITLIDDFRATLTKTTDANGKFTFTNLANGDYKVTPSLTGYIFSPASATITITGTNVVGVNFTATTSISGAVSGDVLMGVTITLCGTGSTTTTDKSGNYSFSGLVNGIYKVTPSLSGYKFIPASSLVIVGGANAAANFTARLMTVTVYIKKSSIKLLEMQTKQLTAIISPSAALNKNVIWTSSNTSVASVSSTGLVTAVAAGNAEVTATTSDGNMISTYPVEVVSPDRLIVIIKADDLGASYIESNFIRLFKLCNLAKIPFSASLIIGTLETATASQLAFLSNLDPQEECELFIHGYTHYMKNDKTEFNGPDKKTQIATFKKILDTCQLYLKRDLTVFGPPGNVADSNTKAALYNFPQIKTIFFLSSLAGGNRVVLPWLTSVEYTIGKMNNHDYLIERTKKLPAGSVAVFQIHPNGWGETDWREFSLLIKELKNNAIFMTPSEYAKWIERLRSPDLRAHEKGTI